MSELTADAIVWSPDPHSWPSSDPLLRLALRLLARIEDEVTAGLVEELARLVTDRDEQIAAMREGQSVSFEELRRERLESRRLRDVVIGLREEMRQRQAKARTNTKVKAINKGMKENKREEKVNSNRNANSNNKHKGKDKAKWICARHCQGG